MPSSVVWGYCAVMLFSVGFATEKYTEFRDWEGTLITEPPMATTISDEGLKGVRAAPLTALRYPVRTVSVERAVRAVTEAAAKLASEKQHHSFIAMVASSSS